MSLGYIPQNGGYNPYTTAYGQQPFMYQPLVQQNMQMPVKNNALTAEEIQKLRSSTPSGFLNISVDTDDLLRAMCTHKDVNGVDVVQPLNDGSGNLYCPICGAVWDQEPVSTEEVKETVNKLLSQCNKIKWLGDLPTNIVRDYFTMMPLIKKFLDLFEYGSKNFERQLQQKGFLNAADANIFAQYNGLFGPQAGYNPGAYMPQGGYVPNYGAQPVYNPQAAGVYNPQAQVAAAPGYNPMAMPQGYNPQFQAQANMIVPGYGPGGMVPPQPVMQPQTPQQQMQSQPIQQAASQMQQAPQVNAQPVFAPAAAAAPQAPQTQSKMVNLDI